MAAQLTLPSGLIVVVTVWLLVVAVATTTAQQQSSYEPMATIRINCGGPAFTDYQQNAWSADMYFAGQGSTYAIPANIPIAKTDLDVLYQTERFFAPWNSNSNNGRYEYVIPVTHPGTYYVVVHFAEVYYQQSLQRVFDVYMEGTLVDAGLDIFRDAGAARTALTILAQVVVAVKTNEEDDSNSSSHSYSLTVALVPINENPKISGIEVIDALNFEAPTAAPTVTMSPTNEPNYVALINCGGGAYCT